MDTPEKNKIGTPVSKFEDSPVFNYINSLSPIKPVKSLHITQTFSSLSFASLPSVFTSPHVSSHKESRFLRRYSVSGPSKPVLSSENEGKACASEEGVVMDPGQLCNSSSDRHENSDLGVNNGESSVVPLIDSSKFVIELPRTLKYDCGSPDCLSTPCGGVEEDFASGMVDPTTSLEPCAQEAPEKGSSDGETQYHELCLSEQRKEGADCDWESLIPDSADILIFDSPNRSEDFKGLSHNPLEPVTRFCTSLASEFTQGNVNSEHHMQIVDSVSSEQQREEIFSQAGDARQLISDFEPTQEMFYHNASSNSGVVKESDALVAFSCKSVLSLHRGIRRRCLDFEMAGARRKTLDDGSNGSSSLSQPDEMIVSANEKKLGPLRLCDSSRRVLPGIGLHLNALAATSKDCKIIKNDNLSSGIQIRIPNSSMPSLRSPTAGQEAHDKSLASASAELDSTSTENGVQLLQDGSQAPESLAIDEFNQNSPKKKRRRMENAGETEGCKRCNCKKSKCLKLYCECFAAGVYCIEPCSCQECFNKPIHEDTVLATRKQIESRNPLAFAPKVIRSSDSVPEYGNDESSKTPASARHKRGCNCKKSSCLKKYCECYQGGVGCSINCRCEGCKNAFGRKDGSSALIDVEADEPDDEEAEGSEKSVVEKHPHKIETHNNEEQNPGSTLPVTPLRMMPRPLVPLPFSSKGKPPRSSFLSVASCSSGLYSQKPSILRSQPKFEKRMQTIPDNGEVPEILRGDSSASPSTIGIKTLSPNSKRISPPQCHNFGSPGRRTGRKLILQSIPSFPSLTPHQ